MLGVLLMTLLVGAISSNITCADKSVCYDGETCCLLPGNKYGCCPLPEATCCSDGAHCCPNSYICDLASHTCFMGNIVTLMLKKRPLTQISKKQDIEVAAPLESTNTICPDRYSFCPDKTTCCLNQQGRYSCCLYPNGVCCNDLIHCCPYNYKCQMPYCVANKASLPFTSLVKKQQQYSSYIRFTPQQDDEIECDDKSVCSHGQTCCRRPDKSFACCPYVEAACCLDGDHCCPQGFFCDFHQHKCTKKEQVLPMKRKLKAISFFERDAITTVGTIENDVQISAITIISNTLVCPDGVSQCPDGNTCCKLSSGEYGCCPLPYAVCCKDGIHCCPHSYTCSDAGFCTKEGVQIKALKHNVAMIKASNVVCPDRVSECPDGSTCCKLGSGGYGCCPVPNAVCCQDGVHCCPNGYSCSQGFCTKEGVQIKALKHNVAMIKASNVVCPDGLSECPDGSTCCKLGSGGYGCCPVPNAVCCQDGVHCCPNGYSCSQGFCTKEGVQIKALKHNVAMIKASNVVCPDGVSECPDGSTCCKLGSGGYGCCPVPNAVCCQDGVHCCPNGYSCSQGFCTKEGVQIKALKHNVAMIKASNVVCPDGVSECPDGSTCCKLGSGGYGCCPVPNAVCCQDGVHCCPNGYSCSQGFCTKEGVQIKALKHNVAMIKASNVVCPDGVSECPDGSTCCKLGSGGYGCCPAPNAVCCQDGVHCCPNGYSCSQGFCTKEGVQIKSLKHNVAMIKASNVVCPDGVSECPDGSTCCKLGSGGYGCCPAPNAVCCQDGVHCCPNGYSCSQGFCTKEGVQIKALKHNVAMIKARNVVCPDGVSECPDGSTCCKLGSGGYGCCPVPNAVCCQDGVHCCPNGYSCSQGFCTKEGVQIKSLKHNVAMIKASNVVCPDGVSECPDGSTCCKLGSGGYGCCPAPNAVCCQDGVHCCPNGYSCSQGFCTKEGVQIKALKHNVAMIKARNVVCPDGVSECPDGSTCCKLGSGGYGCCPVPNAVCCQDGVHCCPNGYSCSQGFCTKEGVQIKSLKHNVAMIKASNVVCPDGVSECPDGSTCCKLGSGGYGCCPAPNAVCCQDGVHCCPNGYSCSQGFCTKEGVQIKALKHNVAMIKARNVVCPDGVSECPDGSTCCKLGSGGYGCCPVPNAVCCQDGVHCCPNGYSCSQGFCTKEGVQIKALKYNVAMIKASNVVCPDGLSECPDGSTCCKLGSGGYGCCPVPNAVCCKDGVHCCPSGYSCSQGGCYREGNRIAALKKTPPINAAPLNRVCADGVTECPNAATCCNTGHNKYACCPVANAVCCADGVHCCPGGYTCQKGGLCTKKKSFHKILKDFLRM